MNPIQKFALAAVCIAAAAAPAGADEVKMKLIPTGAMPKLGGYMPQRLQLSDQKPATITKTPSDLSAPLYGTLKFGAAEHPASVNIAIDEPDGKPSRLFVDGNGNGDLTDDPAAEWTARTQGGYTMYMGGANVTVNYEGLPTTFHLAMYRFDKNDPNRAQLKNTLLYYSDYAYEGDLNLGGKKYHAMIADRMATGDFRAKGAQLLIDVNGNGKFDPRGEVYDITKPFNIAGTTYEIKKLSPSGGSFEIVKSSQTVAEILPPPDLSAGNMAIKFEVQTTDGKTVQFPSSFKGKLVMLDFWATWCGPCKAELPGLTAAYKKYHDKGFEILGISLDQKDNGPQLASFTKEHDMPWAQVYDGKYWQAAIAELYVVQAIPAAFLVDGDTGKVVASGNQLRGPALDQTLEKALAKK